VTQCLYQRCTRTRTRTRVQLEYKFEVLVLVPRVLVLVTSVLVASELVLVGEVLVLVLEATVLETSLAFTIVTSGYRVVYTILPTMSGYVAQFAFLDNDNAHLKSTTMISSYTVCDCFFYILFALIFLCVVRWRI